MGDITLWGRLNSANVQKVSWLLEELDLAYEHVPLGGPFAGNNDPDYLALNPNGLVPTLRDGDLVLWESHAIVRYLTATYSKGKLWPEDPRDRAIVDQWTDWTASTFQRGWITLFWLIVRTPRDQHDAAAISRALADTNAALRLMDRRLEASPFLGGDTFTYADVVSGVAMYRLATMGIDRADVPNVDAWHERLRQRPAFRKMVEVSYDDLIGRLSF